MAGPPVFDRRSQDGEVALDAYLGRFPGDAPEIRRRDQDEQGDPADRQKAGGQWKPISKGLPNDFGFPIAVHSQEPQTVYVLPIDPEKGRVPPEGKLRVYRSRDGGRSWQALTKGLPQKHCYVSVLRDAMAVDTMDPCGVYFGTTGGQVYASADGGDSWAAAVRDLPYVLSVEVQTLK